VRLRPARRCRADSLRTKPSAAIAAWTRSRVAGATVSGRLRTLLTVPTETPAAAATSRMLAVSGGSSAGQVLKRLNVGGVHRITALTPRTGDG
jgi:uncharacterized protein YgbK (DUF1537 family)